ncbi:hypothetical protein NUW54_g282 [Trametes sanguinea]|uniref:Uncharacterized protein n=2 Tax=Trametes sanguinea TaxID=158606 RepID=A0ACC1QCM3_9APHY|nr:hypothetical protein NUW54_g2552 [Trametes sanguinea]KAJ3018636.1 hypothetical protein NUW54_g282 [Trametes sanguinea]
MFKLDARGYIAIAEIVIYVPILVTSIPLVFRHGFTRKAGWIFLVVMAIIRIIGGVTHVLSEQNPSNINLQIIFNIMESSGLSPLLVASVGFLGTVVQYSLENNPLLTRALRLMGALGTVALILAIVGGIKAGNATTQSDLDSGTNFRKIGAALFGVLYAAVVLTTLFCLQNKGRILHYRRKLLNGITMALPFLFVRVLYAILSAFSPSPRGFDADGEPILVPSSSPLKVFNSTTGSWEVYLCMAVVAEYIVVLIYTTVGLRTPLSKDEVVYAHGSLGYGMQDVQPLTTAEGGCYSRSDEGAGFARPSY